LLEHTPVGTSAVDVMSFIIRRVRPWRPVHAHSDYIQAYKTPIPERFDVFRTSSRTIRTTVAELPVGLLTSDRVHAKWHFDENDRLTDITAERVAVGP
jgi:hypothetical protein